MPFSGLCRPGWQQRVKLKENVIVIGALEMVPKGLVRGLEEFEIRG